MVPSLYHTERKFTLALVTRYWLPLQAGAPFFLPHNSIPAEGALKIDEKVWLYQFR